MGKSAQVRIIGGQWKRHLLTIAPVEGLRPTPDRVRETVFNWLGQQCEGFVVLDLYSGTGALGLEAASRGASEVVFVEQHPNVCQQLKANIDYLQTKLPLDCDLSVLKSPAEKAVKTLAAGNFDVIFLDPPFGTDELPKILPALPRLIKPDGVIYIEWGENLFAHVDQLSNWFDLTEIDALRHLKAGQVHSHLVGLPSM